MKKIFTIICMLMLLKSAKAQVTTFPYFESFESVFTAGTNVQFIPNWTGNTVASGSRIFADSANALVGSVALGIIPTSSFNADVQVALNLSGISNMAVSFYAKTSVNGTGDRQAIIYCSTSIDGGTTFSTPQQVGDSTSFPNSNTSYSKYVYPLPNNTNNQSNVIFRMQVSRGLGVTGGTAAHLSIDSVYFKASSIDLIPPAASNANVLNASSIQVVFSEPLNATGVSIANYTGVGAITNATANGTGDQITLNLTSPLTIGQYYTLTVAGVQDLAGNTMSAAQSFQIVFNNNTGPAKITEIFYNNPGPGTDTLEFFELKNLSGSALNVGGWKVTSGVNAVFPSNYTIPANGYMVLSKYKTQTDNFFSINSVQWDQSFSLNNTGETIAIYNTVGDLIDSVKYSNVLPWDTLASGYGHSLVLCNEQSDNDNPANWIASLDYKGQYFNGTTNDSIFASPGGPCITVGIAENQLPALSVSVYPNPAGSLLRVKADMLSGQTSILTIADMTGRIIYSENFGKNYTLNTDISLSEMSSGMYILKLESGSTTGVTRFVKQ